MDTSWITDRWCPCFPQKFGVIVRGNRNILIHMTPFELTCLKKAFLEKNIVFKKNTENFDNDIACWTYEEYRQCDSGHNIKPPLLCFLGYKFIVNKPALDILNPNNKIQ